MSTVVLAQSFPSAERESALIQYFLRYIRRLDPPVCERYTILVMIAAAKSSSFQVITLNIPKKSTIDELKLRIAQDMPLYDFKTHKLVLCHEHLHIEFPNQATLASLELDDVTVVRAVCVPYSAIMPPELLAKGKLV